MTKHDAIKEYLLSNMGEMQNVVSQLNSWNGCLEYLEVYEFDDEFFETFFAGKTSEAVRAWHFGGNNNIWSDEYIRFNGYGNLETLSSYQYQQELRDSINEIVGELIENYAHVDVDYDLQTLLDGGTEEDDE